MRGVSKPITLDVELTGVVTDPWGGDRAVFSASGEVDREDWGLVWNMALESGGVLVSKKIRFEIETEIVLQKPEASSQASNSCACSGRRTRIPGQGR